MKILCLISLLLFSFYSSSQNIKIQEENFTFSTASNVNTLTVEISYAPEAFIDARLKKLLKSWGKHKESKGEHTSLMVEIKDMGKMPFNVYARLTKLNNENTRINFGFDLGGAYLSSREHGEQFKVIEKLISDFASNVVKDWISEELKKEEKVLGQLQKDQKELLKRKENLEKEIEDFKKKITQNEKEVKENIDQQSKKKEAIATQDKLVKKVDQKLKELH